MSRREKTPGARRGSARGAAAGAELPPLRACCMVSELLEETGIDREHLQKVRRQVLQGIVLLCQWQLERMDEARERAAQDAGGSRGRRGRNISVE